jgi:PBP1b-binding outer membrane lipoprotein LpoB
MKMRIHYYIQVLALLGAVSCSSSEPSADQNAAVEPTTESAAKTSVADVQDKQAMGDTRPEVRYYLLSEK